MTDRNTGYNTKIDVQPDQLVRDGSLRNELNNLDSDISGVSVNLDALEMLLNPLMQSQVETLNKSNPVPPASCSIVGQMREARDRVMMLADRVHGLTERVML